MVFGLKMRVGGLVWGDWVKQVRKKVRKMEKNEEKMQKMEKNGEIWGKIAKK